MAVATERGAVAEVDGSAPRRRDFTFGVGWLAALLILGLLLGAGGTLWAVRNTHPGDTSPEAGFLRDMSRHHGQAVELAMIEHANGSDPEVTSLAADIALTQHGQISFMQSWLRDWRLSPTGTEPPMAWMPDSQGSVVNGLMPGMATPSQLRDLRAATGTALDVQFLTLMRQHHLGGIHMAQAILEQSDNKDVTWLAETMVSGQQSDLNLIDTLLKKVQAA